MSFPYGPLRLTHAHFKKNQSTVAQKAEQESETYLTALTHLRTPGHTWAHLPLVTSLLSTYHVRQLRARRVVIVPRPHML